MPACVAARTWPVGDCAEVDEGGCERRRRPGPRRSGAEEFLEGRYSAGTWSPGRRISGEDMVRGVVGRDEVEIGGEAQTAMSDG